MFRDKNYFFDFRSKHQTLGADGYFSSKASPRKGF